MDFPWQTEFRVMIHRFAVSALSPHCWAFLDHTVRICVSIRWSSRSSLCFSLMDDSMEDVFLTLDIHGWVCVAGEPFQTAEVCFVISTDFDGPFTCQRVCLTQAFLTYFGMLTTKNDRVSNHGSSSWLSQSLTRIFRSVTNESKLSSSPWRLSLNFKAALICFFVARNILRISSIRPSILPHLRVLRMWILQVHQTLNRQPTASGSSPSRFLLFRATDRQKCIVSVGWNGAIFDANFERSMISPEVWISPLWLFSQSPWILLSISSQLLAL